ncbi:hypothetical protein MJO28_016006 [Puccinia striiformis f. sp. tritici]|uniref:Uncharacterized protein n=1 Tax=Puccinia striiformis f. sp. tritici TaxID=168172 RepID=A0ACC0DRF2_9BASI|nr:hypothetical protein Pst134EB_029667 [Puccinia striiformis f. sp. tritici]KAI7936087.1 hypothetical protein MJO29_015390 [Puccinia striiformis f. sp. tritici]KAI7937107.1 hypothetical protein MJO28_016006 [Puccinia striiformis f. sp. tritici]
MQLFLFLFGLILSQGVIGAPAPVNDIALHDMGSGSGTSEGGEDFGGAGQEQCYDALSCPK